jgi:hypothetical protein
MTAAEAGAPASDPAAPPEPLPARLDKLKFYRSEIQHEFSLLSARISAYITSQSFLVIGFATSMGNMNPRWGSLFRLVFPLAVTVLGLATSLLVWPGIQGACATIDLWHEKQQRLLDGDARLDDFRVERPLGPSRRGHPVDLIHERSLIFARWAPVAFTGAWSVFGALALILALRAKQARQRHGIRSPSPPSRTQRTPASAAC